MTKVDDAYSTQSYILPVQFLTERTFVAGHNYGCVTIGTNGVERTVSLGKKRGSPSKLLVSAHSTAPPCLLHANSLGLKTVARLGSISIIASACGHVVSVQIFEPERRNPELIHAGRSPDRLRFTPLDSPTPNPPLPPPDDIETQVEGLLIPMTGGTSRLASIPSTPTPLVNRNRLKIRDNREYSEEGSSTPRPIGAFHRTPLGAEQEPLLVCHFPSLRTQES